MKDRVILHLDMDAFFPAIEERENPQFRGMPVIVGADPRGGRGRGVVSSASYRAREYGIHSAMPISQAYKLCPEAIFLPVNGELYGEVSKRIFDIVREKVPIVEQVSVDEAYLDTSYLSWGEAEALAKELKQKIWKTEKLTCTCGIAPNKMLAKIVCEKAKPDGIGMVEPKEAEKFLEPMEVEKIPGIGKKTAEILHSSDLHTVADLRKLSEDEMEDLFGKRGKDTYWRVRGVDSSPVVAEREVKSIGKEYTFEQDTRDPEALVHIFEKLSKEVANEVEEQGFSFKTITVVCRFTGFETHTKAKTLDSPSTDLGILRVEAMKLFLNFIVTNLKPIRLIGVRVTIARAS